MTVGELIEELNEIDPDTYVYIDNGDGEVSLDEVVRNNFYGYIRKVVLK